MKKLLWVLLLCYCAPLWAGLGDPMTYSLPRPPNSNVPPTPFDLPVPPRPTTAPTEHTDSQPFNARLDALWGPKKIRVQNDNTVAGLSALCHVQIYNSLCQANSLHVLTDQDELLKSPLDRLNPSSYVAVSGFTDYFDLRIQGTTACKIDVSCEYISPRTQ
jgi:hypothetical protein